jgi:hypothetical protein
MIIRNILIFFIFVLRSRIPRGLISLLHQFYISPAKIHQEEGLGLENKKNLTTSHEHDSTQPQSHESHTKQKVHYICSIC